MKFNIDFKQILIDSQNDPDSINVDSIDLFYVRLKDGVDSFDVNTNQGGGMSKNQNTKKSVNTYYSVNAQYGSNIFFDSIRNKTIGNISAQFISPSNQQYMLDSLSDQQIFDYELQQPSGTTKRNYYSITNFVDRCVLNEFNSYNITYDADGLIDNLSLFTKAFTPVNNSRNITPINQIKLESISGFYDYDTYTSSGYTVFSGVTYDYSGVTTSSQSAPRNIKIIASAFTGTTVMSPFYGSMLQANDTGEDVVIDDTLNIKDCSIKNTIFNIPDIVKYENDGVLDISNLNNPKLVFDSQKTLRVKFGSFLNLIYTDTGLCNYISTNYDSQFSGTTFLKNNYDYKNFINSTLCYAGGQTYGAGFYKESTMVSFINPSYSSATNGYGYAVNRGINNLYVKVYLELSGATGTTEIDSFQFGLNPRLYPSMDAYMVYDIDNYDRFNNSLLCNNPSLSSQLSGHGVTKKVKFELDSGCYVFPSGHTLQLKYTAKWASSTKYSGTTGTTNMLMYLGDDIDTDVKSFFLIKEANCQSFDYKYTLKYLNNKNGDTYYYFNNGLKTITPTSSVNVCNSGFTDTYYFDETNISYLDIANNTWVESITASNNWITLFNTNKVSGYEKVKVLDVDGKLITVTTPTILGGKTSIFKSYNNAFLVKIKCSRIGNAKNNTTFNIVLKGSDIDYFNYYNNFEPVKFSVIKNSNDPVNSLSATNNKYYVNNTRIDISKAYYNFIQE